MSSRTPLLAALAIPLVACAGGFGPSTAATRPLLGHTISNDDATMWAPSSDQSGVPVGLVRVEQVSDGFARVFNYVSITSAIRMGSAAPEIDAATVEDNDVLELDAALTARIPLPIGGVSIGAGHLTLFEDEASLSGFGVRASVSPIAQLSADLAMSWIDGELDEEGAIRQLSGRRTSVGATLLLWGYNTFRFGVAAAKTWTSAGAYESSGYTYNLVWTIY